MNETSNQSEGRDDGGRFTAGNPGGPGNPFARQTAAMRKVIHNAVTAEQVQAIIAAMVDKAIKGDVAAAKLVLAYRAGQPGPTPNPDVIDAYDQALRQEKVPSPEDVKAFLHNMPTQTLVKVATAVAAHLQQQPEPTPPDAQPRTYQRDKDTPAAAASGPKASPAFTPARPILPDVADLVRSVPHGMIKALCEPEVNPLRLVPITDSKRDNATGPAVSAAAQTGKHRNP